VSTVVTVSIDVAYQGSCEFVLFQEKTVFLRYMNVLSAICFLLNAIEIVVIPLIYMQHKSNKR